MPKGKTYFVQANDSNIFVITNQGGNNPSGIENPYNPPNGGASGLSNLTGGDYYFQMGSSFNGAGCTSNCTTFADPGPDPAAGTTHTWDTSITALNTALYTLVTVVFKLAYPYAPIAELLAWHNYIQIEPTEADGGFDPRTDMRGSGAWFMEEYRPSQVMRRAGPPSDGMR